MYKGLYTILEGTSCRISGHDPFVYSRVYSQCVFVYSLGMKRYKVIDFLHCALKKKHANLQRKLHYYHAIVLKQNLFSIFNTL